VNDRQVKTDRIEIILAASENAATEEGIPVIVTPSSKGIVLFRSLVPSEDLRAEIDAKRRQSNCKPL